MTLVLSSSKDRIALLTDLMEQEKHLYLDVLENYGQSLEGISNALEEDNCSSFLKLLIFLKEI